MAARARVNRWLAWRGLMEPQSRALVICVMKSCTEKRVFEDGRFVIGTAGHVVEIVELLVEMTVVAVPQRGRTAGCRRS